MSGGHRTVLLIVCDTLRPDYLSIYGGDVESTVFRRMATEGTVFERAYAAGPGSSISHAALFSGQYSSTSGVGGQVDIPLDTPLLAAHLRDHGYQTFGLPGPSRTGSHWGYHRGFDEYLEKWTDIPSGISIKDLRQALDNPELVKPMPAEIVRRLRYGDDGYTSYLVDVFERKIQKLEPPYFAFMNLTTTHTPYDPPRSYKETATPSLQRPKTGFGELLDGEERLERDDVRMDRLAEAQAHAGVPKLYEDQSYLSDAELDVLKSWYRASIRYLDDQLQTLFRNLRVSGELENTIVILTADHGEQFGEHGLLKHMYFHFDSCLHVPLVIAGPGVPADNRREDFVSLIDIFPTVCNLIGTSPPENLDGRPMFTSSEQRRSAIFAENGPRELSDHFREHLSSHAFERFGRGLKSVRTDDYLFTVDSSGEQHLYELPGEVERPLSEGPVKELKAEIHDTLGESFPPGSQSETLDSAVESNLRELGYIA